MFGRVRKPISSAWLCRTRTSPSRARSGEAKIFFNGPLSPLVLNIIDVGWSWVFTKAHYVLTRGYILRRLFLRFADIHGNLFKQLKQIAKLRRKARVNWTIQMTLRSLYGQNQTLNTQKHVWKKLNRVVGSSRSPFGFDPAPFGPCKARCLRLSKASRFQHVVDGVVEGTPTKRRANREDVGCVFSMFLLSNPLKRY